MANSYVRGNFQGGEFSKFAQGRYDLPNYPTALNVCLNMLPTESGGMVRRPGTRFIDTTFAGRQAQLFRFSFENKLPYTIEVSSPAGASPGGIRFIGPNALGQLPGISVTTNNTTTNVSSISNANPAVVTTATAHGLSSGNAFKFFNLGTSLLALQNETFAVATVISPTQFTMINQSNGVLVDGTNLGGTPSGVFIQTIQFFASSYGPAGASNGFDTVRHVQIETSAVLLQNKVAPQAATVTLDPSSGTYAQFNVASAVFNDGPYIDQYIGAVLTPSGVSGSVTVQASGEATFPGFQTTDVGRLIRLFSQPAAWNVGTPYTAGQVVSIFADPVNQPGVATYYAATTSTTGNTPPLTPQDWTLATPNGVAGLINAAPNSQATVASQVTSGSGANSGGVINTSAPGGSVAVWTWGIITAVNVGLNQATVSLQGPNLLYNNTPIYAWRMGAFGGLNGYPTCGVYTKGRLWLGGSISNRVDACVANGITTLNGVVTINFAPTNSDGTVGASNAIAAVFNDSEVNPVLWMASHQQGVIAGTQAGEFLILAPTAGGIAPNNIDVSKTTSIGSLVNIEAQHGEHTLLFVHRYGRKIMEYFADVFSGKFSAPHVTVYSKHLTLGNLQQITYQQELIPTLWARVANQLKGWVYKRESLVSANPPTIAAGHRHVLGTGRDVESIASGPSADGTSDTLMMITNDPTTNIRYIEALNDFPDEGDTLLDAQYVDCAVAPTVTVSAPTVTNTYGGLVLGGLSIHNGKTVSAWVGGLDCGDYLVSNGEITVPFGDGILAAPGGSNPLLTQSYFSSIPGIPIWCGFTYTSQGQIVRPNHPAEAGTRAGPGFMKKKRSAWIGFQLEGAVTRAISFGSDFSGTMDPLILRQYEDGPELPVTEQFTGIWRTNVEDDYDYDAMICWQVTRPYPANIVAVGASIDTTDL